MTNILIKKQNDFNKTFISWNNVQEEQKEAFNSMCASILWHLRNGNYEPLKAFTFTKNNIPNGYTQLFKKYLLDNKIYDVLNINATENKITKNQLVDDDVLDTLTDEYLMNEFDVFKYKAKKQAVEWEANKKIENLVYAYIKNELGIAKKDISPQVVSTAITEIVKRIKEVKTQ
jgi:hypothetical protein